MDGLLLSGGGDLDPALYDEAPGPVEDVDPARDALELEAWRAARARNVPVLGICRGFQAINVFAGGKLLQHVDGHRGRPYPDGPPHMHPLRLQPGSRLARILHPTGPAGVLRVNSYHHQGLRREDVAPGFVASGLSRHPGGELVEAIESASPMDFVLGVQCHPERTEWTPPEFVRLWTVFVDASRGSARGDRVG